MKYEAVFGNQDLFDGAGTFTGLDVVTRSIASGNMMYCRLSDLTPESLREHPVIAMRRIIQEPKRWTAEDWKAKRLPPAGSKYLVGMHNIELECLYNDSKGNAWGFDAQGEVYGFAIKYCSPIETPEEKAERLEDEFVSLVEFEYNKMPNEISFRAGLRAAYRKLKGGE